MRDVELERMMLRNYVKNAYRRLHKPGSAYYKFVETFGHDPDPEYYFSAIFGDNPTSQNKQEYYDFLKQKYSTNESNVFKFYLLEFKEMPREIFNPESKQKKSRENNRFDQDQPWYIILGISGNADQHTIKQAWKALSKVYHPDLPSGNLEIMQIINAAYDRARGLGRTRYY